MRFKKITKKTLMNYYSDKDLKDFLKISNYQALNWLEEANRFFYKVDRKKWRKDQKITKKIGW